MASKKIGRKPRAKGVPKNLLTTWYPSERARLRAVAKHFGLSQSGVLRELIDRAHKKIFKD